MEIMLEEEVRIMRTACVSPRLACAACGDDSWMVAPEEAALALGLSVWMIYRWVEEARIHFRTRISRRLFNIVAYSRRSETDGVFG